MEVLFKDEPQYFNEAILERVNPAYKTARTTLSGLAATGDADARAMADKLRVSEKDAMSSERSSFSDEMVLINEIVIDTRYHTIGRLALQSGASCIVDLPCGFTPRGIQFARENRKYIGLDLPASILESRDAIMSLLDEDKKHLVRYAGCDATNYESLEKALEGVEGEICVCTEGLLMYFTESETDEFCENIRALLKKHGGCWLTSDPEVSIQYGLTLKTIFPQLMEKIRENSQKNVEDKAEIRMSPPSLIVMPAGDMEANMKKALGFLKGHGLKAERFTVSSSMGDLKSLKDVEKEKAELYREAMGKTAFWKITLAEETAAEKAPGQEVSEKETARAESEAKAEARTEGKDFAASISWEGTGLKVKLNGRVDTLTAPSMLSLYEEEKKKGEISHVIVDCTELDYISSAGLRVLLIMHKGAKEGIRLEGIKPLVRDILEQTGFSGVFGVTSGE